MESLGRLLQRGQGDDQEARTAALVVSIATKAIQSVTKFAAADAKAVSVNNGTITVVVSHGAVAGRIQRAAPDICDFINQHVRASGGPSPRVQRIVTRQG